MSDESDLKHNCLEHIMSVEEAAKAWNVSTATVKNLCMYGQAKAIKLGGTWVIDKNQPNPKKK